MKRIAKASRRPSSDPFANGPLRKRRSGLTSRSGAFCLYGSSSSKRVRRIRCRGSSSTEQQPLCRARGHVAALGPAAMGSESTSSRRCESLQAMRERSRHDHQAKPLVAEVSGDQAASFASLRRLQVERDRLPEDASSQFCFNHETRRRQVSSTLEVSQSSLGDRPAGNGVPPDELRSSRGSRTRQTHNGELDRRQRTGRKTTMFDYSAGHSFPTKRVYPTPFTGLQGT
jgi:hypothetical protein